MPKLKGKVNLRATVVVGGKPKVFDGEARELVTFLHRHEKGAERAEIVMSATTAKGEHHLFERNVSEKDAVAAALSDAQAWLSETAAVED